MKDAQCLGCRASHLGYCWLHAPVTEGGSAPAPLPREQATVVLKNQGPMLVCSICGYQSLSMKGHGCAKAFAAGRRAGVLEAAGWVHSHAEIVEDNKDMVLVLEGLAGVLEDIA